MAETTVKTRGMVREIARLALYGEYAKAEEIMREYCVEKTEFQGEWDRKCAEAVKNGAVLNGEKGTDDHSIQFFNSEGNFHREDGPAREDRDGYKIWVKNGLFHREDGPALIRTSGKCYYYLNGGNVCNLPTKFGDASEGHEDLQSEWDLKCLQAVIDGAEITKDGAIMYLKDGQNHNETGPAVKFHDGRSEFWIKGTFLTSTKE